MKTKTRWTRLFLSQAIVSALFATAFTAFAQQTPAPPASPPTMASMMDAQLSMAEKAFVAAAEAMPDDKYSFAPPGADFSGVRTFALEVRHVATANYVLYSSILGQDLPKGVVASGVWNGTDNLQTKEQIVQYLKDSFALGHKAMATLNSDNALVPLAHPVAASPLFTTRLALAVFSLAHASDHYGQMVEYLRMNGIVPPASVGQPSANPPPK